MLRSEVILSEAKDLHKRAVLAVWRSFAEYRCSNHVKSVFMGNPQGWLRSATLAAAERSEAGAKVADRRNSSSAPVPQVMSIFGCDIRKPPVRHGTPRVAPSCYSLECLVAHTYRHDHRIGCMEDFTERSAVRPLETQEDAPYRRAKRKSRRWHTDRRRLSEGRDRFTSFCSVVLSVVTDA